MISILIPAYKTHQYIEECLDSIVEQKFLRNIEYEIILGIDNCDDVLNTINKIKNRYSNLRIIYMKKNYGLFITLNTLISLAKYENIIKFDSDDIMLPSMIEDIMNVDADLVRFKFFMYYGENKPKRKFHVPANGVYRIKKHVFDIFGGYQPWKCSADTEFLVRFSQYGKFKHIVINKELFLYRQHEKSLTKTIPTKQRLEYHQQFKNKKYNTLKITPVIGEYIVI